MRKITNLTVAIFTFFLGVSIYFVFLSLTLDKSKPLVQPVKYSSLPILSVCEATRNHRLFESRDVRLRGYLAGRDGLGFFIYERDERDCAYPDAKVSFLYENETLAETDKLLKELSALDDKSSTAKVGVEIVGRLRDENRFSSSSSGRFSIEAKEVRQISPITQTPLSVSR